MLILEKLDAAWSIGEENVKSVLDGLDAKKWLDGESLDSIIYAGLIDDDTACKSHGHTGYWVATEEGYFAHMTNADPVWDEWAEELADELGISWGDFAEEMEQYRI